MPLRQIDINGSFEQSWNDVGPEQQAPHGWIVDWVTPGSHLWDSRDVAGAIPEIVHHGYFDNPPRWTLPEDERPGGANALILDGVRCLKAFHSALPWGKELWQVVADLEPGTRCEFAPHVQVHYRDAAAAADPWNAEFGCWLNREGGWNHGLPDREWWEFAYTAVVPPSGRVELLIRSKAKRGNADFFFDNWVFKGAPAGELKPAPPPAIDMLDYLVTRPGTIVQMRYLTQVGQGEQLMQGQQIAPLRLRMVRGNEQQQVWLDKDYLYRGIDTSPSPKQFYVPRTNELHGQRWCARKPQPDERWDLEGTTTTYYKANCAVIPDGTGSSFGTVRYVGWMPSWSSPVGGPVITDLVKFQWIVGGNVEEEWHYARGRGLVGWQSLTHGFWSYCSEILDGQPDLVPDPLPPCADAFGLDQLYFVDGEPEPKGINIILEIERRFQPARVTVRYV